MNKDRRKAITALVDELEVLKGKLEDIKSQSEDIKSEEEEYRDNMPENMQASDKYSSFAADAACDALYSACLQLDAALDEIGYAIENLDNVKGE